MLRNLTSVVFVIVLAAGGSQAVASTIWDVYNDFDFSMSSNTADNTWQFGRMTVGTCQIADFSLNPNPTAYGWGGDLWENSNPDKLPSAGVYTFGGGSGGAHPYVQNGVEIAGVIGWKSPSAQIVEATFSVFDANVSTGNGIEYRLYCSGVSTPLASGVIDEGGSSTPTTVSDVVVSAGQMLFLQIGPRDLNFAADSTGVHFAIAQTGIPEPSSIALLVTGLIGLLCYAWRKRR
jgi:hypothetical protein